MKKWRQTHLSARDTGIVPVSCYRKQARLTWCGRFHRKLRFLSPPSLPTLSVELRPGRCVTERGAVWRIRTFTQWEHKSGRWRSTARKRRHLSGEHCDVVENSLTSLFDGQREEKPAPVLREQRLLSLQRQTDFVFFSRHFHSHRMKKWGLPVWTARCLTSPRVSEEKIKLHDFNYTWFRQQEDDTTQRHTLET